ncbi:cytidine deaminase [bacterium]|nr:cytidine deaminase [bacterium]
MAHAKQAILRAQVAYSGFPVGAALLAKDGSIFTGCNIESSSYGLTLCAERVALAKALSEGVTEFKALAIATPNPPLCPPCGACRQLLWDYASNIKVILAAEDEHQIFTLRELLPHAFDEGFLR